MIVCLTAPQVGVAHCPFSAVVVDLPLRLGLLDNLVDSGRNLQVISEIFFLVFVVC